MKNEITVNVCMGTGGIAAGGEMVMQAFHEEFEAAGIKDAKIEKHCKLHKVGCRGFCARDVLVDISVNGEASTYQYIEPKMVKRLVKDHVIGGKPVTEWLVGDDYHTFHDNQKKIILSDLGKIDPESIEEYLEIGGYKATRKAVIEMTPDGGYPDHQGFRPAGQGWRRFSHRRQMEFLRRQRVRPALHHL